MPAKMPPLALPRHPADAPLSMLTEAQQLLKAGYQIQWKDPRTGAVWQVVGTTVPYRRTPL